MGVNGDAVNMKRKESRRAVGLDPCLRNSNAHSLLFAFLCSQWLSSYVVHSGPQVCDAQDQEGCFLF